MPRPTPEQLSAVPAAPSTEQCDDLRMRGSASTLLSDEQIDALPDDVPRNFVDGSLPDSASIEFPPFGRVAVGPVAEYRTFGVSGDGAAALEISELSQTWELAQRLKAGASTPYEYVLATGSYLRRGFTYTERPPEPAPGQHPLESFLFDTKAGYCQHYSAAMALLLRMGGIPARVATGFSPGGFSKRKAAWIVRDTDAHSWVEAWFDGLGWVTLDPTPSATPARSQISALAPVSEGDDASAAADAAAEGEGEQRGRPARRRRARGAVQPAARRRRRGRAGAGRGGLGRRCRCGPCSRSRCCCSPARAWPRCAGRRGRPDDPLDLALWELETALRRSGRGPRRG